MTRFFWQIKIRTCSSSWIEAVKGSPSATLATIVIKIIFENISHNDLTRFFFESSFWHDCESHQSAWICFQVINICWHHPRNFNRFKIFKAIVLCLLSLEILKNDQKVNHWHKNPLFLNLVYFRFNYLNNISKRNI